jgi:hypothetical protein
MPWIGHPGALSNAQSVVVSDSDICRNRPWLPARRAPADITAKERADMALLAERLLPALSRPGKGIKPEVLVSLREQMAKYRIVRRSGVLTGCPIGNDMLLAPPEAVDAWDYLAFCRKVQQSYAQAKVPEDLAGKTSRNLSRCSST